MAPILQGRESTAGGLVQGCRWVDGGRAEKRRKRSNGGRTEAWSTACWKKSFWGGGVGGRQRGNGLPYIGVCWNSTKGKMLPAMISTAIRKFQTRSWATPRARGLLCMPSSSLLFERYLFPFGGDQRQDENWRASLFQVHSPVLPILSLSPTGPSRSSSWGNEMCLLRAHDSGPFTEGALTEQRGGAHHKPLKTEV